ncbi:MAG: cbb3-type cytochrome oxidase assembly protein CcoS [Bdellovibrionota bacterium]
MSVLYVMLPISLALGLGFLIGFIRMSSQGQFDDLETPAHRMLLDDDQPPKRKGI